MGSGRGIALAGLMAGLVVLAPVVVVPGGLPVVAQTADQRKAEGDRLLQQGLQHYEAGDFTTAIQSWQQALTIYRAIKDRKGEGQSLGNLGNAYQLLGNDAKAIEVYKESLAIARELKDRQDEGASLGKLGLASISLGNYAKAIEYLEPSVAIAREFKNRHGEGASRGMLGIAYQFLGNYAKAIEFHQQRLAIAQELKDRQGEGHALGRLGMAYHALRNYTKAIEYYEQSLAISRELKNRGRSGTVLQYLGGVYQDLGNSAKAIEYHEQSLAIARELKDRLGEGAALGKLGDAYSSLGNYAKAIELHQQSLAIAREIKDRQGEGTALLNLGNAYRSLGNFAKALEFHRQHSAISQEIKDRFGEGASLGNLGKAYLSLGNYAKAIELHQQSLAILREIKDRQGEGTALLNLGDAYLSLGNYAKALEFHQQHLAIARELKDRQGEGAALLSLGNAYLYLGDYAKAIEFYQQSLAIAREIKNREGEARALNNLGGALEESGNLIAAQKSLIDAIQVWESLRTELGANDANKVSIFERQAATYRTLQKVLIARNQPQAALEIAERGRARAFVELLAGRLRGKESGTGNQESGITPPKLQDMQQIAKAQNATLVQYSIIGDNFKIRGKQETRQSELYIWIIPPAGEITFRKADLKPLWQQQNTSLANVVEQSREAMGARGRSDIEVALSPERLKQLQAQQTQKLKQLHQLLIEPIADLLPKDPNQRVIFMPQGELFLVPFPSLLDANNKPLLAKHTILTAPSIQVLELTRQQRRAMQNAKLNVQNVLVVGNPTMPKVVTRVGDDPVQLSDLPGAKREALAIASLLNAQAVTGAQATKAAIAQQMPNARIIHLATHGLLDDTKGLGVPGAIALAPAGNGQLNDGLLTSDEILDMKLNAELVVLSACDTGRGRITGDGVIGLSRSLITAGVPSIVVSLWKVPDEPTAFLMTEFYKNLQASPNKAQALRQAMLTTKQKYPDPLNWAAFTLIGEAE